MNKELIKLAFQLGYNQGCEDLIKQAEIPDFENADLLGTFLKHPQRRDNLAAAKKKMEDNVNTNTKPDRSGQAIQKYVDDLYDAKERNKTLAIGAGGAAALASLIAGGKSIQSYRRAKQLKKLRNRNLWQRILNK